MERPPVAYRNVVVEGARVRGEYTTTEATEVFPHGEWLPFDQRVEEWWVRLAVSDDRTNQMFATLLNTADTTVLSAFRAASPYVRLELFELARTATGMMLPASLLEVPVATLEQAAAAVSAALEQEANRYR